MLFGEQRTFFLMSLKSRRDRFAAVSCDGEIEFKAWKSLVFPPNPDAILMKEGIKGYSDTETHFPSVQYPVPQTSSAPVNIGMQMNVM